MDFRYPRMCLALTLFTVIANSAFGEILKANSHIYHDDNVPEKLSSAIADLYEDIDKLALDFEIEVRQRSLLQSYRELSQGIVQFHYPVICEKLEGKSSDYFRTATRSYGKVPFFIYSSGDKALSYDDLANATFRLTPLLVSKLSTTFSQKEKRLLGRQVHEAKGEAAFHDRISAVLRRELSIVEADELSSLAYPYKVLVQDGYTDFINIPSISFRTIVGGLKRVATGRVDAVIDNQFRIESAVKKLGLDGQLTPRLYDVFSACFLIPKTPIGEQIDNLLVTMIPNLPKGRSYERMFGDESDEIKQTVQKMTELD